MVVAGVVAAVLIVAGAAAIVAARVSQGGRSTATTAPAVHQSPPPTATVAVAPFALRAPLGAEVVLPVTSTGTPLGALNEVEILGGSTTGSHLANGVFALNLGTGGLTQIGDLTGRLADAAGALIAGQAVVFGGDNPTPVASVQSLAAPGTTGAAPTGTAPTGAAPTPTPVATVIGSMPEPRAGAGTTEIGNTTFIVGGSDGSVPDPDVLATIDGRAYSAVATLRVPVAFPAVATIGTHIYVFGGEALSGPQSGQPVSVVQKIDPATHSVTVTGSLPRPLAGAAAALVAGHVLIIGGDAALPSTTSSSTTGPSTTGPSAAGATPNSAGISTSSAIWIFQPSTRTALQVGTLSTPVARAGVTVVGSAAWIVGGLEQGAPTSVVQAVTLTPRRHGG
jgi:hypothetical protein